MTLPSGDALGASPESEHADQGPTGGAGEGTRKAKLQALRDSVNRAKSRILELEQSLGNARGEIEQLLKREVAAAASLNQVAMERDIATGLRQTAEADAAELRQRYADNLAAFQKQTDMLADIGQRLEVALSLLEEHAGSDKVPEQIATEDVLSRILRLLGLRRTQS